MTGNVRDSSPRSPAAATVSCRPAPRTWKRKKAEDLLRRLEQHRAAAHLAARSVARRDLDVRCAAAGDAVHAIAYLDSLGRERGHHWLWRGALARGARRAAGPGTGITAQGAQRLGAPALRTRTADVVLRVFVSTYRTGSGCDHVPFS